MFINTPLYPKVSDLQSVAEYWETEQYLLETEYQLTQYRQSQLIDKEFTIETYDAFSKELLANVYAAEAKPDSLRLVINDIATDSTQTLVEKQNTVNYLTTVATVLEQQQTVYTAGDNLVTTLPTIENSYTTKASVHASSALKARNKSHHVYTIAKFTDNISTTRLASLFSDDGLNNSMSANTDNFKIYPNPNNGVFALQLKNNSNNDITCTITNIMGQIVKQLNFDNHDEIGECIINVSELPSGMYIVQLSNDNLELGKTKIIIE